MKMCLPTVLHSQVHPEHLNETQQKLLELSGLFKHLELLLPGIIERYAAPYGLTVLAFRALSEAELLGGRATLTAIGERIMAPPSSMTGVAARLEQAGFVERHPSPSDRRSAILEPTPEGTQVLATIHQEMMAHMNEALGDISTDDLDVVIRTFNSVIRGLAQLLGDDSSEVTV